VNLTQALRLFNDDPDDGWEGGLDEALRYVDVFMPNDLSASSSRSRGNFSGTP
jgi:hypothetical protein